jgi:hypothetical protein
MKLFQLLLFLWPLVNITYGQNIIIHPKPICLDFNYNNNGNLGGTSLLKRQQYYLYEIDNKVKLQKLTLFLSDADLRALEGNCCLLHKVNISIYNADGEKMFEQYDQNSTVTNYVKTERIPNIEVIIANPITLDKGQYFFGFSGLTDSGTRPLECNNHPCFFYGIILSSRCYYPYNLNNSLRKNFYFIQTQEKMFTKRLPVANLNLEPVPPNIVDGKWYTSAHVEFPILRIN